MNKIGTAPTRDPSRDDAERDAFIAEHYGVMSYREMGAALGVSHTTVYRRAKALRLTAGRASARLREALERIEAEPADPGNDQLRRLCELRDMQHELLKGAVSAQAFASMSREYRETLRQIAELTASPDEGAGPDADALAGPMADLMAAMPDLSALAALPADG